MVYSLRDFRILGRSLNFCRQEQKDCEDLIRYKSQDYEEFKEICGKYLSMLYEFRSNLFENAEDYREKLNSCMQDILERLQKEPMLEKAFPFIAEDLDGFFHLLKSIIAIRAKLKDRKLFKYLINLLTEIGD